MKNLWEINTIKDIMTRHGFQFSKSLGQNFLINPTVCPQMAEQAISDGVTCVIEIGAGVGILTAELAKRAKKVVSIEVDSALLPVLEETLADFDNVEVINADVLKTDINRLIEEKFPGEKVAVCANLPYYITSPIIMYFLEEKAKIENMTVMVQKEAADRLCAEVGSRESGAVTVAVNYYAEAKKLFSVSSGSFMPAPKVDSAVMQLKIREKPPVEVSDEKKFFALVKSAFSQRRKTAVNGISSGMSIPKQDVISAIERAGLDVNVRAEKLTMEELARLCEEIQLL